MKAELAMYQVFLGKISTLSTDSWAEALAERVPQNVDRARWLAVRGLLSRLLAPQPLPDFVYGEQGKPALARQPSLWFNLSHSGDDLVLMLSDEGEVGCDLERIRPHDNWRAFARMITGARWLTPFLPWASMQSWNAKRRKHSFRRSGVSGRVKRRW